MMSNISCFHKLNTNKQHKLGNIYSEDLRLHQDHVSGQIKSRSIVFVFVFSSENLMSECSQESLL